MFVYCGHPILSLHFVNLPHDESCLPRPVPETQIPTHPCSPADAHVRLRFRMGFCGVVAVPKGSELLENTVAKLLVLPGHQQ